MQRGWSFCIELPEGERESSNVSYSGGDDLHCSLYTEDQFQGITTLEKVGSVGEQSNITEPLMDSGAACHVCPCRMTVGYSCEEAFLTNTGAQVTSQGTLEVKSHLVDVHGERITVKTVFELILARCSILSVGRSIGKFCRRGI